jgi:hypothetical protein
MHPMLTKRGLAWEAIRATLATELLFGHLLSELTKFFF